MDNIDRGKVIKGLECCRRGFCFACPYNDGVDGNTECKQKWADDALPLLKTSVSQGVFDQIKWERDMAIAQLEEIGKGLGEKMDDVKEALKAQEPVKPFFSSDRRWLCGNCMREVEKYGGDYYCPGCGRKLLWE